MSLAELVPIVATLPSEEKRQLADLLVGELVNEDDELIRKVLGGSPKVIWTPLNLNGVAQTLLDLLPGDRAAT